jgi:hypothetical protein
MKAQARDVQYTVRGVPPGRVERSRIGARKRADFSDLVGKRIPDPAFDEVIAAGRKIDRNKWK